MGQERSLCLACLIAASRSLPDTETEILLPLITRNIAPDSILYNIAIDVTTHYTRVISTMSANHSALFAFIEAFEGASARIRQTPRDCGWA